MYGVPSTSSVVAQQANRHSATRYCPTERFHRPYSSDETAVVEEQSYVSRASLTLDLGAKRKSSVVEHAWHARKTVFRRSRRKDQRLIEVFLLRTVFTVLPYSHYCRAGGQRRSYDRNILWLLNLVKDILNGLSFDLSETYSSTSMSVCLLQSTVLSSRSVKMDGTWLRVGFQQINSRRHLMS